MLMLHLSYVILSVSKTLVNCMATLTTRRGVQRAHTRIDRIRSSLAEFELICSGTLSQRMMKCGKPTCRCASNPSARHGPYYEWGRMRGGKATHRYVNEQQAQILRQAIDNYRVVKQLLREWEENTERLIDAVKPPAP
jgi:hypothetical protein